MFGEWIGVQVHVDGQWINDGLSSLLLGCQRAGKYLQRLESARQDLVLGLGTEIQYGCALYKDNQRNFKF